MITNAMFHNQTYAVYIRLGLLHVFNTAALFSLPKELDRKSALLGIHAIVNWFSQETTPICTSQDLRGSNKQHSTVIMASKGAAIKLYTNHRCPCKCTRPSSTAPPF